MSVTDEWQKPNETKKAANKIGLEIETSIAHDNLEQYRLSMGHANEYMKAHPDQQDVFKYEVEAKLGRDGYTPAATKMELMADANGSTIPKLEIEGLKNSPDKNPIERDLLAAAAMNYDSLPPWFLSLKISNASVSKIHDQLKEEQEKLLPGNHLRNFFEKDASGLSLYDRVKDNEGNIKYGAISGLLNQNLDPLQRDVLTFMDQQQHHYNFWNWIYGGNMTKGELEQLATTHGTSFAELTGQKKQQYNPGPA